MRPTQPTQLGSFVKSLHAELCGGAGFLQSRKTPRTGEITQQVKVLATKADSLSMIPRTHMVEGEPTFSSDRHTHAVVHTHTTHPKPHSVRHQQRLSFIGLFLILEGQRQPF